MRPVLMSLLLLSLAAGGCSDDAGAESSPGAGRPGRGGPAHGGESAIAVPVEVLPVVRQSISSFIETNGTLEAEKEVDIVARTSAPVLELAVEEGANVRAGQLLARLDAVESEIQIEIARVAVSETRQAYERALQIKELISPQDYERAVAAHDSANAQLKAAQVQLEFTELRAPFAGHIVRRYVDVAQQVSVNTPIFRLSDFDPLLCPIQIPEKDLSRVRRGQTAWLSVEAWPGQRFPARVQRISPIVESDTGTIKVTLEIAPREQLRPGMFARVFVETESRANALVVPKAALSLESIGDTVYVATDGIASRREVKLGFRQGDLVEIVSGVAQGEQVVVVGQDGLSEGTPLQILAGLEPVEASADSVQTPARLARKGGDFSSMSPQQLEQVKQRMRSKGMSEDQIKQRLEQGRNAAASGE